MTTKNDKEFANILDALTPEPVDAPVSTLQMLVDGVCYLAGVCDFAHSHDGKGFNGSDANFGHAMAERITAGKTLTPKMIAAIGKMLQKYKNQLGKAGLPTPTKDEVATLVALLAQAPAPKKQAFVIGNDHGNGWLSVRFPFEHLEAFKGAIYWKDRHFDRDQKKWFVKADVKIAVEEFFKSVAS